MEDITTTFLLCIRFDCYHNKSYSIVYRWILFLSLYSDHRYTSADRQDIFRTILMYYDSRTCYYIKNVKLDEK